MKRTTTVKLIGIATIMLADHIGFSLAGDLDLHGRIGLFLMVMAAFVSGVCFHKESE